MVEKKNMRRESRMDDTLEALWMGPYKVLNVDKQRVTLYDLRLKRDLKQTVAYDQLRPHLTGSPKLQGETSEPASTPVPTPEPLLHRSCFIIIVIKNYVSWFIINHSCIKC